MLVSEVASQPPSLPSFFSEELDDLNIIAFNSLTVV